MRISISPKTIFRGAHAIMLLLFLGIMTPATAALYFVDITDTYRYTLSSVPNEDGNRFEGFSNLFKNNWGGNNKWNTSTSPTLNITFDDGPQLITVYTFTSGNDSVLYPSRHPTEWLFQGFNGTDWITLDHQTGITVPGDNTNQTFYLPTNTTAYQDYRFQFFSTENFQLCEIQLGRYMQGQDATFRPGWSATSVAKGIYGDGDYHPDNVIELSGRGPAKLFDKQNLASPGNNDSKMEIRIRRPNSLGDPIEGSPTADYPWMMTYTFPAGVSPNLIGYNLSTGADGRTSREPSTWTLRGSNDGGATWTDLHQMVNGWFQGTQYQDLNTWNFEFDNAKIGNYHMLQWQVTGVRGGGPDSGNQIQVGEMTFIEPLYIDRTNAMKAVTCSSEYSGGGEVAVNAFDDNLRANGSGGTKWLVQNVDTINPNPWVAIDLFEPSVITRYSLSAVIEGDDGVGRTPKEWDLYGSNDGINWNLLDSRSDITNADYWNKAQTYHFDFDNSTPYSQYKLQIFENNGSVHFQLANFNLYEQKSTTPAMTMNPGFTTFSVGKPGESPTTLSFDQAFALIDDGSRSTFDFRPYIYDAGGKNQLDLFLTFPENQFMSIQEIIFGLNTVENFNWELYGLSGGDPFLVASGDVDFVTTTDVLYSLFVPTETFFNQYMFSFSGISENFGFSQFAPYGNQVPEPAAWIMTILGLLAMAVWRRKRT